MNVGLAPVSSLPTGNASQSSVARGRLTRRTRVVDEARRRPIGSPCATIIPRRVLAPIPRRGVRSALRDSRVDRKPRCSDPPPPRPRRPGERCVQFGFSVPSSRFFAPGFFLVSVVSVFRSLEFRTIRGRSPAADHASVSPRPFAGDADSKPSPLGRRRSTDSPSICVSR